MGTRRGHILHHILPALLSPALQGSTALLNPILAAFLSPHGQETEGNPSHIPRSSSTWGRAQLSSTECGHHAPDGSRASSACVPLPGDAGGGGEARTWETSSWGWAVRTGPVQGPAGSTRLQWECSSAALSSQDRDLGAELTGMQGVKGAVELSGDTGTR